MSRIDIGKLLIEIGIRDNFSKEIAGINKEIKGLERQFKNLDKAFDSTSKSMVGLEQKSKVLNDIIAKNQAKLSKQVTERDKLIQKYNEEKQALDELKNSNTASTDEIKKQQIAVVDRANQINKLQSSIESAMKADERYTKQLAQVNEQIFKVSNGIEDYEEKISKINSSHDEMINSFEEQEKILKASHKSWAEYDAIVSKTQTQLSKSVQTYKTSAEELSRLSTEQEKITKLKSENLDVLKKEQNKLEEIRKTHSETSSEYMNQVNHINSLTRAEAEYEKTLSTITSRQEEVREIMKQSRKDVIDYSIEMGKLGNTKITQNLHKMSGTVETLSEATQGASVVAGVFGGSATKMFFDYESGLAKVNTIANKGKNELEGIGKDMIEISNETGTSISDLLEGGYQAYSAMGEQLSKTGELQDMMTVSAKLSTAGFADNASVVKLLAQVYNTLGSEMGSYEDTANKLLTVQNLGVTTIAEMSANMGESLSLASAYGISFDNVASSFIKCTKAKILVA